MMIFLQEAVQGAGSPSVSEWRAILLLMGTGIAAVFGGLTLTQKGRTDDLNAAIARMEQARKEDDAAHERAIQAERDRTNRAEKTADEAMARLASTISVTTEQTSAIREFGSVVKESAIESRRIQERLDLVARTNEDLRRAIGDLRTGYGARPPEAPSHGD